MRSREPLTIPIQLDLRGEPRRSLHAQITDQMIVAVDQGRLPGGMRMPSTRTLAAELGISRGVASAAYTELLTRGYLESRRGSGTYVAARARATVRRATLGTPTVDFTPGRLAGELFPTAAWTTAWRRAASAPPPTRVPLLGLPELCNALVRQVLWPMGMSLDRRIVVITNGAAHALRLVLAALGGAPAGLELPAPPAIRAAVGTGVPLLLDEQGPCLDGIPPQDCRVIVVAPDGQLPLGRPMTLERRRAVVAWAERTGGHVVVLTPAGTPSAGPASLPGLLAGAGVDRTVLAGAIGEHLAPALQLGYAVVPAALAAPIIRLLRDSGETPPPYVVQLAAAELLRDGTMQAHSRGVARLYAYKRRFLQSALEPFAGRIRLGAPEAVGTTPLYLPPGADAVEVAATLAAKAVRVQTLTPYYWTGSPAPPALVIAYGHPTGAALRQGFATLTEVIQSI